MVEKPRRRRLWLRYQQLTLWNKLGVWAGLASILGLGLTLITFLWTAPAPSQPINRNISANGNITVTRGAIQTGDGTIIIEGSSGSKEEPEKDKP